MTKKALHTIPLDYLIDNIATFVRIEMKRLDLSYEDFGSRVGTTRMAIWNIVNSKAEPKSPQVAKIIRMLYSWGSMPTVRTPRARKHPRKKAAVRE